MSSIRVIFRCGHDGTVKSDAEPICPICGRRGVQRAFCEAPRFTGHADGPLVTKRDLGPATVKVGL